MYSIWLKILTPLCFIMTGQTEFDPLILNNPESVNRTYSVSILELDDDKKTILGTTPLLDYSISIIDTLTSTLRKEPSYIYVEPDTTPLISPCYYVKWFADRSDYLFETVKGLYVADSPDMEWANLLLPRECRVGDRWYAGPDTIFEITSIDIIKLNEQAYSTITITQNTPFLDTTYRWALGFGLISHSFPTDMGHKFMLKKYEIRIK